MLSEQPIVAFVPTVDAERARAFYADVLGLEFVADDGFAVVLRGGSTTIRIVRLESFTPQPFTVLGWHVADIEAEARALAAKGVELLRFEGMAQDELGIWRTPGGAVAWFHDPDGNTLSLSSGG